MHLLSSALNSALLAAALWTGPAAAEAPGQPDPHLHGGASAPSPAAFREKDRLMTDEVARLYRGLARIRESASRGDLEALRPALSRLEQDWRPVKTELELREAAGSIEPVEEALASLGRALRTGRRPALLEGVDALSGALDGALHALAPVVVDGSRLLLSLTLGGLAWFGGSFLTVRVMQARRIKL